MEDLYYAKYLKYKNKYKNLSINMSGGTMIVFNSVEEENANIIRTLYKKEDPLYIAVRENNIMEVNKLLTDKNVNTIGGVNNNTILMIAPTFEMFEIILNKKPKLDQKNAIKVDIIEMICKKFAETPNEITRRFTLINTSYKTDYSIEKNCIKKFTSITNKYGVTLEGSSHEFDFTDLAKLYIFDIIAQGKYKIAFDILSAIGIPSPISNKLKDMDEISKIIIPLLRNEGYDNKVIEKILGGLIALFGNYYNKLINYIEPQHGFTLLMYMITTYKYNNTNPDFQEFCKLFRLLIEESNDDTINHVSKDKTLSAIRLAILNKNDYAFELLLTSNKIKINQQDDLGDSLLITAIYSKYEFAITKLLEYKINVNLTNKNGGTALMLACMYKNQACVEKLLQIPGIISDATNKMGANALMYAVRCDEMNELYKESDSINQQRLNITCMLLKHIAEKNSIKNSVFDYKKYLSIKNKNNYSVFDYTNECIDNKIISQLLTYFYSSASDKTLSCSEIIKLVQIKNPVTKPTRYTL